jgi:hypothetical protein
MASITTQETAISATLAREQFARRVQAISTGADANSTRLGHVWIAQMREALASITLRLAASTPTTAQFPTVKRVQLVNIPLGAMPVQQGPALHVLPFLQISTGPRLQVQRIRVRVWHT